MPKHLCASLALFALAIAGCSEDAPSKSDYVADLDKVCKRTNERIQKVKTPRTIAGIGAFARETRPIIEDSIKEAEDIELPDEDGDRFEAYVRESKSSLGALDDLEKAADAGDGRAVRRVFAKTAEDNKKRSSEAERLGLKECGGS